MEKNDAFSEGKFSLVFGRKKMFINSKCKYPGKIYQIQTQFINCNANYVNCANYSIQFHFWITWRVQHDKQISLDEWSSFCLSIDYTEKANDTRDVLLIRTKIVYATRKRFGRMTQNEIEMRSIWKRQSLFNSTNFDICFYELILNSLFFLRTHH